MITIIVLIILAGVTINALSGENGILKRATQAKSKTGRANALEQINLAIITARTEGLGQVDKTTLRDEITKAGMTVKIDGDDLPWEVVSNKYIFRINEDYTVEEISGIGLSKKELKLFNRESETITATLTEGVTVTKTRISVTAEQIAANPEKYYGQVAQNYTQGDLTYRIFYVDKENKFGDGANTIYLKADFKSRISLSNFKSYTSAGSDLEVYKKVNPSWAVQRGNSISNWNINEHVVAWLCSPSVWTAYCDATKANYVIGGPSVEMYVESYNQVPHIQGGNYTLRCNI